MANTAVATKEGAGDLTRLRLPFGELELAHARAQRAVCHADHAGNLGVGLAPAPHVADFLDRLGSVACEVRGHCGIAPVAGIGVFTES